MHDAILLRNVFKLRNWQESEQIWQTAMTTRFVKIKCAGAMSITAK